MAIPYKAMYVINFIRSSNWRFLKEMKDASQLDSRTLTIFPSLLFLTGAFALIYQLFHKRNTRFTPTRLRVYRELGFHWTYFYIIRMWLVIVKGFKMATAALDKYAEEHSNEDILCFKSTLYTLLMISLLCVSSIPMTVVVFKYYMRETIPDFLMWIGQDPWLRSEIGLAGHYLDRPPTFSIPQRKELAYRSKRSTSNEDNAQTKIVTRTCKSMVAIKCVKSIQELLH